MRIAARRSARILAVIAATAAVFAGAMAPPASGANAQDPPPSPDETAVAPLDAEVRVFDTWEEAHELLGPDCLDGSIVVPGDGGEYDNSIANARVQCDLTLDLRGFGWLPSLRMIVEPGNHLTITNTVGPGCDMSALVERECEGTWLDAFMGLAVPLGAKLTITGDIGVYARGALGRDAAIGGSSRHANTHAGEIEITGNATVRARAADGAAIGGGFHRDIGGVQVSGNGGTVTITDHAYVLATSSTMVESAAVGGSNGGIGGNLTLGPDATLIAAGGATAIGGTWGSGDGNAVINGTLYTRTPIFDGDLIWDDGEFTVGPTGQILGSVEDPIGAGRIAGAGTIVNNGVIALTNVDPPSIITNHHYDVQFVRHPGTTDAEADEELTTRVYAPDFGSGYRDIPIPEPGVLWMTEPDGGGAVLDDSTQLANYANDDGIVRIYEHVIGTTTSLDASSPIRDSGPVDGEPVRLLSHTAREEQVGIEPLAGTVTFTAVDEDGVSRELGNAAVNIAGIATLDTSLPAGDYTLTASYDSPEVRYAASTSDELHRTVQKAPVRVVPLADPADGEWVYPEPVEFSARFYAEIDPGACDNDPGSALCPEIETGTAMRDGEAVEIDDGVAQFVVSGLDAGEHTDTIEFVGDDHRLDASGTVTYEVSRASTVIDVDASAEAIAGEALPVSVSVSAELDPSTLTTSSASPSGTVELREGDASGDLLASTTLDAEGVAQLAPVFDTPGTYHLVAVYTGADNFSPVASQSFVANVARADAEEPDPDEPGAPDPDPEEPTGQDPDDPGAPGTNEPGVPGTANPADDAPAELGRTGGDVLPWIISAIVLVGAGIALVFTQLRRQRQ
ncbi:Ig-like domain-containing protein [Ruania halotolerans]|uniref:Ig-like domain-containing protein n=1 Tax=Ruania halotolerans TaxID=2897773 RepID=UPI001E5305FD|nr:Ig-like domain-containing protein [Ruania halotolerans]UFU06759.1 Ig-like domain-containing protein [Ruania halotolerans]